MQVSNKQKPGGFTLVELMVTLALGMVVVAAVTTTFMSQTKFYSAQEQINEMEQNARGALDIITRELKMAGYNPNGGTVTGVTYSASQLQIQADLDGSGGFPTGADETITYSHGVANNQIVRNSAALADNITNFTFQYFKADGITTTTVSSEVRQVRITITARTAKPDPNYSANGGYRTYTVSATITPVNLGL